ncbi:MAG: spore coat protein CotJB [Alistipes sp.]|nr:spore coat protein CotJB [Alistipes sp.]
MTDTRKALMHKLQQYDFMLKELQLYLDTHPNCANGLAAFEKYTRLRNDAAAEYNARFSPVTVDANPNLQHWQWVDEPFPWEV